MQPRKCWHALFHEDEVYTTNRTVCSKHRIHHARTLRATLYSWWQRFTEHASENSASMPKCISVPSVAMAGAVKRLGIDKPTITKARILTLDMLATVDATLIEDMKMHFDTC